MLSEGAIQEIISKPPDQHPQKPVLQILGIKKIQTKSNEGSGNDRYRLVLSDGVTVHTSAMLATQLNDRVTTNEIEVKAVIRLDKYICNVIQETRKVLIVLEVSVLKTASEVPGKIGDPKSANADSGNDQKLQQPQQNGQGAAIPQQNMTASNSFNGRQQAPPQRPAQQARGGMMGNGPSGGAPRGGGLASATYGSNQPLSRGGDSSRTVYPISSLTPYQNRWTIRARVTSKSNIRTWSNSKGEGRVFNVDLVDESGEIRATGFNDAVDKFYELLEVNKVVYISKCSLRTANKQYSSIKNDYEMYINNDSNIELCTETVDLPTLQYNFVNIADLANFNRDDMVDVLGIVINSDDLAQITTKSTNRQVYKRDITLLDRSEKSVRATLWGDDAEKFEEHVGKNPVLALKGAKVSEFGGRSLSILNSTNLMVNPLELKEAHSLRGWYDNIGKESTVESISGMRSDSGSYTNFKTLNQIKAEQLGMGEKPDYLSTKATVVFFKKDNCLYKACPSADCNKKVIEEGDDTYRCEKCNKTYPDYKYRLILQTNLADFSGNQWVTCFQESAESVLNKTAAEIGQLKDSGDEQAFDQIFSEASFKTYNFKVRAKMETYNDETRLKCSCMNASLIDFKQDSKRLIGEIKKLMAL